MMVLAERLKFVKFVVSHGQLLGKRYVFKVEPGG